MLQSKYFEIIPNLNEYLDNIFVYIVICKFSSPITGFMFLSVIRISPRPDRISERGVRVKVKLNGHILMCVTFFSLFMKFGRPPKVGGGDLQEPPPPHN